MFINDVYYTMIDDAQLISCPISDDSYSYFKDLYAMYEIDLSLNHKSCVYRYDDMVRTVMSSDTNRKKSLDADAIFFPSWHCVTDLNGFSSELYLKNQFGWSASILDVRDCGSLCVYYAIYLLLQLSKTRYVINGAVFTLENKPVFSDFRSEWGYPDINYAALLSLSRHKNKCDGIEIIDCAIFRLVNHVNDVEKHIQMMVDRYDISESQCEVIMRKISNHSYGERHIFPISHPISSGFLYCVIDQMLNKKTRRCKKYTFILDFDTTFSSFGIVLLKMERESC